MSPYLAQIIREARRLTGQENPPAHALALRAVVLVRSLLSRPNYLGMSEDAPRTLGSKLERRAGQCGDHAQLFCDWMRELGFDCCQWGFRFDDGATHVGVEVKWDDAWHFYDLTWGAFWGSVEEPLPLDDVLAGDPADGRVADELGLALTGGEDPWAYLAGEVERWPLTFTVESKVLA